MKKYVEEYVEKTVDYLVGIVGESANSERIEKNIELYASDYVRFNLAVAQQERFEIIEKAIKKYKEL